MVDFKYHVVSIVAVFLALAVGIVLGTNVLSGDVLKNLQTQTSQLRKEAQDLRAQGNQLQAQLNDDQTFAQALEPMAVSGRLAGLQVVIISLPNAQKGVRDQALKTLGDAGAVVTGQIEITGTYVDPQQTSTLDDLARALAPPTVDLSKFDTVPARAAAVLASAIVSPLADGQAAGSTATSAALGVTPAVASLHPAATSTLSPSTSASASKSPTASPSATKSLSASARPTRTTSPSPGTGVTPSPLGTPTSVAGPSLDNASTAILAGLESGGFIKIDQAPRVHATLALVLAPAPPAKATADSATANKTLLELFAQLAAAGAREVVAGPTGSAGAGGLLGDLRGAGAVSKLVSGVDDIDDPSGRIAAVFALQRQAAGQVGQYGTGPGAQGPLPSPSAS